MRALCFLTVFVLAQQAIAIPSLSSSEGVETSIELPDNAFIPTGFDNNDNAQIVVSGKFVSTCFRVGPVKTRINHRKKEITLTHEAYYYPGGWCLFVEVPYLIPVDVGPLPQGDYKVIALDKDRKRVRMGGLRIGTARSSSPDEHMYAPVAEARFNNEQKSLTLKGTLPSTCFSISTAQVIQNTPQVIEVLPIVTLPLPGVSCPSIEKPFEITVQIPDLRPDTSEPTLIHVRSLNGQSLNQVVSL